MHYNEFRRLLFHLCLSHRENAKLRKELEAHQESESGLSEKNVELQEMLNVINSELYNVMTQIVDTHFPRINGVVDAHAKVHLSARARSQRCKLLKCLCT